MSGSYYENALHDDELHGGRIEKDIHDLMPHVHMSPEYCTKCKDLRDNRPETIDNVSGEAHNYHNRPHFQRTVELEALLYRKGCRLCVLFVQRIYSRGGNS